jgi:hypothetical protein
MVDVIDLENDVRFSDWVKFESDLKKYEILFRSGDIKGSIVDFDLEVIDKLTQRIINCDDYSKDFFKSDANIFIEMHNFNKRNHVEFFKIEDFKSDSKFKEGLELLKDSFEDSSEEKELFLQVLDLSSSLFFDEADF